MAELTNKDGQGNIIEHPEIVKSVLKEINLMQGNQKTFAESIQKDVALLKEALDGKALGDKVDPLIQEKVTKITESITLKQEQLDLAIHKRVDEMDVAIQRIGKNDFGDVAVDPIQERKDAMEYKITQRMTKSGISHREADTCEVSSEDLEQFRGYKKAFREYLTCRDEKNILPESQRFLSVGQDPDGGYWVPPTQVNRIIQRMFEVDPMRQLAGQITISSDRLMMSVDFDDFEDADTGWETELQSPTVAGTPQIGKKEIVAHTLVTQPKLTQQIIEDAIINPENFLADKVASKFERVEGAAFISGDGIGKPRGILTYGSTWAEGVTGIGNIEQVNMGAANNLTTDGFIKVMYSLLESFLFRGTWLMNRLAVRDTMLLKDGDGVYIWRMGLQAGQPSTILTVPVRMSTTMPVVAANTLSVAIADWREAYLIVDRLGISVLRDPYTATPFIKFYTRKRLGGDVVNYQAIKIGKVAA
jgi:HK97 family phage major capsid protein